MLTLEQIKKYYSQNEQIKPRSTLVEYIQYELLESIYKQKESKHLSFMGGTAIRICYNSNRFSEDLDFDNFGLDFDEFKDMLDKVVKDMELKGFEVEFRFVKKAAFHCYVKFPEILYEENLTPHEEEKILVRIDTVKKSKYFNPDNYLLDNLDVFEEILV